MAGPERTGRSISGPWIRGPTRAGIRNGSCRGYSGLHGRVNLLIALVLLVLGVLVQVA